MSTVRVDFHCHSSCSDGAMPPEGVAQALGSAGVRFAALTDHDTAAGQRLFRSALNSRGIGFVSGMELSCLHEGRELHLLAYGFPLAASRPRLAPARVGSRDPEGAEGTPASKSIRGALGAFLRGMAPDRPLEPAAAAIARVHAADGLCFLAHPLAPDRGESELEAVLPILKALGLDGLEAIYAPYPRPVRARLARLAVRHDLLVVGGSDFHGDGRTGSLEPGCDLLLWHWERLRAALALPAGPAGSDTGKEPA